MTSKTKTNLLILLFITVLVILSNFFVFSNGFISDDFDMVYMVSHYNTHLSNYFVSERYGQMGQGGSYRPLFVASFWLDYHLYGDKAWGYHLTNFLLYILSAWLIFLSTKKLLNKKLPEKDSSIIAMITAGLFAVSPMHTESATWISGRTDIIAFFFLIASWYFLLKSETAQKPKTRITIYLLSILAFLASLLSKEMAVVLPILIFFYSIIYYQKSWLQKIYHSLKITIPYLLTLGLYFFMRYLAVGSLFSSYDGSSFFTQTKSTLGQALISHTSYPLLFWLGQARGPVSLFLQQYVEVYLLILLIIIIALGFVFKKYLREYLFIIITYLLFILPVIKMPIDFFSLSGQRLVYFASWPFYFFLALIIYHLFSKKKILLYSVALIIFIFNFYFVVNYNLLWQKAAQIQENIITDFGNIVDTKVNGKTQGIVLLNNADNISGAYIARNSLKEALRLRYPDYYLDMIILTFRLQLDKDNYNKNLISWQQTHPDFIEGKSLSDKFNLISGLENTASTEFTTKLLNFDHRFDVGDKIWITVLPKFLEANKTKKIYWLYFNQGGLEEFNFDF